MFVVQEGAGHFALVGEFFKLGGSSVAEDIMQETAGVISGNGFNVLWCGYRRRASCGKFDLDVEALGGDAGISP